MPFGSIRISWGCYLINKPLHRRRLQTAAVLGTKPKSRERCLRYIEQHTKYHVSSYTDAFAINVKLWHFVWKTEAEKDATFALIDHDGLQMSDFLDTYAIETFERDHNLKVNFVGRSGGWMVLMLPDERTGYAMPDSVDDSPRFSKAYQKTALPICMSRAARRLDTLNDMFVKNGNFIPHQLVQYVTTNMGELNSYLLSGKMVVPTSNMPKLRYAPAPGTEGYLTFKGLMQRFEAIDKELPLPPLTSPYQFWPSKDIIETSNVLWDFNHLAEDLANYTVEFALNFQKQINETA